MNASDMPGSGRWELRSQFNGRPVVGEAIEKRVGAKFLEVTPAKAIDKTQETLS
jgi:hypothetical protein